MCGKLCDHEDIDTETGICKTCKHELFATLTVGDKTTGFDSLQTCLDSVTADTENYIKLYQDITKDSAVEFTANHKVTLDLNGHRLDNIIRNINEENSEDNSSELTLTGTGYIYEVYAHSYTKLTIVSDANIESDSIFIHAGAQFTVSDGAKVNTRYIGIKEDFSSTGDTLTSVRLVTGMKIGMLIYAPEDNSGSTSIMLKNLLADNQVFKYDTGEKLIDIYEKSTANIAILDRFTVVEHTDADHKYSSATGKCKECGKPCPHDSDISTDDGKCSICGAVVPVALYTDENGNLYNVDADGLHNILINYYGSSTVKLFKDYSKSSAQYMICSARVRLSTRLTELFSMQTFRKYRAVKR